tara:strand:+ start:72 stop:458 length:387 start_codon:yes stop_codon:yes gene_type:complete
MQVKLSLTCDLAQVPFKISEILDERTNITKEHLGTFKAKVVKNLGAGQEPTLAMIDEIDNLRKVLYLLDANLLESSQVLSGYIQNRLPAPVMPDSTPTQTYDNQHQQLEQLSEALNSLGGRDDTSSQG